jgi:tetratricopeptide (TPR) repeat protein
VLGEIERKEGKLEQAISHYEEAITIEKELGRQDELMVSQENLAFVHCRLGQYELARTIFLKNLEIALKSDHLGIDITACLLGLASIAMAEGAAPLAAKVLGTIARNVSIV